MLKLARSTITFKKPPSSISLICCDQLLWSTLQSIILWDGQTVVIAKCQNMTTLSPNSLIIQVEGELITDKRAKKHGTAKKLWNKGVMPD